MTSAPAIGFEYRPSPSLGRLRGLVALAALAGILLSGVVVWAKLVLAAGTVAAILIAIRRGPAPPVAVGWAAQSGWTLHMPDGSDSAARLVSSRVWAGMVVLCLVGGGQRHALWLLPDNSDADTRRRLRMRLAILVAAEKLDPGSS